MTLELATTKTRKESVKLFWGSGRRSRQAGRVRQARCWCAWGSDYRQKPRRIFGSDPVTCRSQWLRDAEILRQEEGSRSSGFLSTDQRMGHADLAARRVCRGARVQIPSRSLIWKQFQQPF